MLQEIKSIDFKLDSDDNLLCRLQTGIPNRNMPADLMEKIYLIDIDCYTNSLVEQEDAISILTEIHYKNIEVFEKCIDDKLRGDMDDMNPRFWTQESFENLIHDIAQISKYSRF